MNPLAPIPPSRTPLEVADRHLAGCPWDAGRCGFCCVSEALVQARRVLRSIDQAPTPREAIAHMERRRA